MLATSLPEKRFPELFGILTASLFLGVELKAGGVLVRPFDFALVVLLAYAAMTLPRSILFRAVKRPVFVWLLVVLMMIEVVNSLFLVSISSFVKETLQNIEHLIFLFALSALCVTPQARSRFLDALLIGVSIIAVGAVFYHFSIGEMFRFKDLGEPKYTFGIMTSLLVVRLLVGESRRKVLLTLLVVVAIILTLASGERKGWIALVIAVAIVAGLSLLVSHGGAISSRLVLAFAAMVPIAGVVLLFLQLSETSYIDEQIETIVGLSSMSTNEENLIYSDHIKISNRVRYFMTTRAIEYIENNPVFGIGTDQLKDNLEYDYPFLPKIFFVGAHNEYLRFGAENGVPSLIVYSIMWVLIIFHAARIYVFTPRDDILTSALVLNLAVYGAVANLFMGGDAVNTMLAMVPMALVMGSSTQLRRGAPGNQTSVQVTSVRQGAAP